MRNHGPDTVNVALYVSPCCADIERNRSKKGGFFLQETMPCIHGPSLCVCVYACTRGSCVDSIWLWVRKETFSKPVFGVSKTSISGFVAVGPHCIYIYIHLFQFISCFYDTMTFIYKNIYTLQIGKKRGSRTFHLGCRILVAFRGCLRSSLEIPKVPIWMWCQTRDMWQLENWVVVWNIFYFHPYLGKWSSLTNIFQMGWNHQLEKIYFFWGGGRLFGWGFSRMDDFFLIDVVLL